MKLSEFKDEKAIEKVAELLVPIGNLLGTLGKLDRNKPILEFAGDILKASPKDVKAMLAIMNDVPVEEYHCTAATVMNDMIDMFTDPDMMQLFGLQRQTETSSGSVLENTEV